MFKSALYLRDAGVAGSNPAAPTNKNKGLLVVPGKYFFPGQAQASDHAESCIRMNYVQSEDELARGIEILAQELGACW